MTTINWNCKTVDVYPAQGDNTNVVYNVHWIATGVSDQVDADGNPYTGRVIGTEMLDTSTITNFIPFENLTNETIVGWTKDAMGVGRVTEIESNLESQIDALITPVSVTMTIDA